MNGIYCVDNANRMSYSLSNNVNLENRVRNKSVEDIICTFVLYYSYELVHIVPEERDLYEYNNQLCPIYVLAMPLLKILGNDGEEFFSKLRSPRSS